jgi:hypothetical protein
MAEKLGSTPDSGLDRSGLGGTAGMSAPPQGFRLFAKLEDWSEAFGTERIEALRSLLEEIALAKAPDAVPELVRPDLTPEPAPTP